MNNQSGLKWLFVLGGGLLTAYIFLTSTDTYLIGGSDVIDFTFVPSLLAKVVSLTLFFISGFWLCFYWSNWKAQIGVFLGAFVLLVIANQAVVYSGKSFEIRYMLFGVAVNTISMGPDSLVRTEEAEGFTLIGKVYADEASVSYISLFWPFGVSTDALNFAEE